MRTEGNFTFFWEIEDVFSQWYPSNFDDPLMPGMDFNRAEQYMMFEKAMLFGDDETGLEILQASRPRDQKMLGKKIKGFEDKKWDVHKFDIVYRGNYLKFSQNPKMKDVLMATGETTIVEASPYDKVWGIGLREDDPKALNKSTWEGENLLGKVLISLRNNFKSGYHG